MALLENPVVLEAMLELAAAVAGGKVFVTSTYNLEVGGFGVVIAFDQISNIEAALDAGIPMPALAAAAKLPIQPEPMPSRAPIVTTPVPPMPVTRMLYGSAALGNAGAGNDEKSPPSAFFGLRKVPPSTVTNDGQKPFTHEKSLLHED